MIRCYVCEEAINTTNKTVEHILLNAIGGKLKSKELICKSCNSKFGSDIDLELANQLNPFCNLLNIKRDRGNPQQINVQEKESGEKLLLGPGGKPIMSKPIILEEESEGQKNIQVVSRSMQESKKIMKGLKKKYPQIDIEQEMSKASVQRKYLNNHLQFKFHVGGEKAFRSICKTAVNFYMLKGGQRDNIQHLIPYIKNSQGDKNVCFYNGSDVIRKNNGEIVHAILLKGIKQENILYAYVEFFNAFKFVVLLNSNYEGVDFENAYVFNVVKREEIVPKFTLNLDKQSIYNMLDSKERPEQRLLLELNKLMPLILQKQESDHIKELAQRAVKNSLMKHPEGVPITQDMINELRKSAMKEITPWIINRFGKED